MIEETPEWVRVALRHWGNQKRRIWEGSGNWYLDKNGLRQVHIDGYAESFMGRLIEDHEGAGQGEVRQHWEEVYWGDGLAVQRALPNCPELPVAALHVRYVWNPELGFKASRKAALIGLKERAYWEVLGRGETWIWSRLEAEVPAHTQVATGNKEKSPRLLNLVASSTTTALHKASLPKVSLSQLNFELLGRSVLRLKA